MNKRRILVRAMDNHVFICICVLLVIISCKHAEADDCYAKWNSIKQLYHDSHAVNKKVKFAEEMISLAEHCSNLGYDARATSHSSLGDTYLATGLYKESMFEFKLALYYTKYVQDKPKALRITKGLYYAMGVCSYKLSKFGDAEEYLKTSYYQRTRLDLLPEQDFMLFSNLSWLGMTLVKLNKYEEAEKYFKEAIDLEYSNNVRDSLEINKTLFYLGNAYKEQNKLADAEEVFVTILKNRKVNKSIYGEIIMYYLNHPDLPTAKDAFKLVIDKNIVNNIKVGYRAQVYYQYAKILEKSNNSKDAILYYEKVIESCEKTNDKKNVIYTASLKNREQLRHTLEK